ncbi:hypothetical protein NPIL_285811 [Nephila pilipes]|uniref:Uncharacterized protein n=1 Tax=Nephila pilipes TaxID=299642 RepID=A0A8X6UL11_NEPPI|nr:hypothetical protein NPIL_285811 [Nephila pilipes]
MIKWNCVRPLKVGTSGFLPIDVGIVEIDMYRSTNARLDYNNFVYTSGTIVSGMISNEVPTKSQSSLMCIRTCLKMNHSWRASHEVKGSVINNRGELRFQCLVKREFRRTIVDTEIALMNQQCTRPSSRQNCTMHFIVNRFQQMSNSSTHVDMHALQKKSSKTADAYGLHAKSRRRSGEKSQHDVLDLMHYLKPSSLLNT